MKMLNNCALNDQVIDSPTLNPMTDWEVFDHILCRLRKADNERFLLYPETAAVLLFLYSRGLNMAAFFNTPVLNNGDDLSYKTAHQVYDMMKAVLPTSTTRSAVIAETAEAFSSFFETKDDEYELIPKELFPTTDHVKSAVKEVLDSEAFIDVFGLCMVLSFIEHYGTGSDDVDYIYKYSYSELIEQLDLIPGTDEEEIFETVRVALDIIAAIRARIGCEYSDKLLLGKLCILFRDIADYEERRSLAENGYEEGFEFAALDELLGEEDELSDDDLSDEGSEYEDELDAMIDMIDTGDLFVDED